MQSDDMISLRDYLAVLARRKWLVVTTTLVVAVVAVAASLAETPRYEGDAEIVVEPVRRGQDVTLEQLIAPGAAVETERLILLSRPVTERVIERLGAGDPQELREHTRVEVVRDTRVVRVIANDPDPVQAASIANAYAEAYLDYRRDQALDEVLAVHENLEGRAAELREEISSLEAQITASGAEDGGADEAAEDDAEEGDAAGGGGAAQGDVEALVRQRDALLTQLAQVVAEDIGLGSGEDAIRGGGAVIAPAQVPVDPVSPQPLRSGVLAVLLGLLLGIGLAFLRDHFDDAIRDEADLRRATGDLPVLGRIPHWDDEDGRDRLATLVEPSSLASEAYRELSAAVRFLLLANDRGGAVAAGAGRDVSEQGSVDGVSAPPADGAARGVSVFVVSPGVGAGKTSTASNLAVAAARVGLTTLLVDADLRRPTIARRFGLGRTTGLSDVLLNGDDPRRHVVAVGISDLLVLPAGTVPPNPAELLASPAMLALHRRLVAEADLVVYDTPAVLAVADPLEIARYADVGVLVARSGMSSRRETAAALERLAHVRAGVAGTVLNDVTPGGDYYYYAPDVVADPPPAERRQRRRGRRASDLPPPPPRPHPSDDTTPGGPGEAADHSPEAPLDEAARLPLNGGEPLFSGHDRPGASPAGDA